MRTEGDHIEINKWLLPFSWFYGLGVGFRNWLFEMGFLKTKTFSVPVIAVGNITVGGTGKTPHVEYLVNLLHKMQKVAVLSRGYKRQSKGYVLANDATTMQEIGDEPYQMKQKFSDIYVAVDKKRVDGIEHLTNDEATKDTDVILLDDAFQHRYVKPGVNILLVDYHRLIIYDKLLPAGRLREPEEGKKRADVVIITKCPKDLKPMEYRVLTKAMSLYAYQDLYFTTFDYDVPYLVFTGEKREAPIDRQTNVLLLTAIAQPKQMELDMSEMFDHITTLSFSDHHYFSTDDAAQINSTFAQMAEPKVIITTEKDATRLATLTTLSKDVKEHLYAMPVRVSFMLDQQEKFNEKIISYVRKNSRNSILVKPKDDNKAKNSNHSGDRPRTISFRDN